MAAMYQVDRAVHGQQRGIDKQVITLRKRVIHTLLTLFLVTLTMSTELLAPDLYAQNMRQPVVARGGVSPQETSYDPGLPEQLAKVGIDQKLNAQLPLDAQFFDAEGKTVRLRDYFTDKPVVFAFAYYTCPMLCGQVLQGITGTLQGLSFDVGKEFDVVVISFNPRDSQAHAAKAKNTYVHRYARPGSEKGWHFLYGEQPSIDQVTQAAGFKYEYDEISKQYAHGAAMMIVTPEGKLSKYFFGIEFAPKDVKFALMEAAEHNIGTVVDQLMLYCFHYDPNTGKYGPYIVSFLRLGAGATILGFGAFYVAMRKRSTKRRRLELAELREEQVTELRPK